MWVLDSSIPCSQREEVAPAIPWRLAPSGPGPQQEWKRDMSVLLPKKHLQSAEEVWGEERRCCCLRRAGAAPHHTSTTQQTKPVSTRGACRQREAIPFFFCFFSFSPYSKAIFNLTYFEGMKPPLVSLHCVLAKQKRWPRGCQPWPASTALPTTSMGWKHRYLPHTTFWCVNANPHLANKLHQPKLTQHEESAEPGKFYFALANLIWACLT